ncbi:hypothetical protein [Falsiruegeria mediterranea]|uniref:hypothetical protein n=1 Tax=Falsiruegeria mediterranea TaxID=1280832 RepID=UPI0015F28FE8|nr:hypothetical protein [Falsiruegeria mediterranea]
MQLTVCTGPLRNTPFLRRGKLLSVFAVLCIGWLTPVNAADVTELPKGLQAKVELAKKACEEFDNGQFDLEWGAVERVDLDGDLYSDWILNEFGFACSTAASLYCGTGGCLSHFLVSDEVHSVLNKGWDIVTFGAEIVLLSKVHGSQCGGINPTPCVTASVWDGEEKTWRSTDAEWE